MTIAEKEQDIIREFSLYNDWLDKYNLLVEMGKSLPLIDPQYMTDQYLISGCQSKVWLHARMEEGRVFYAADSDAIITKGIVSLLIRVFSGETPDAILETDVAFIDKIGLKEHLSPNRSNGLVSMIKQMRLYALAFKTKAAAKAEESSETKPEIPIETLVIDALKTVFDPEIPINIYDLGLIYDLRIDPVTHDVYVLMTLTTPNCPVAEDIPGQVETAVRGIEGIGKVSVELTFEPPWDKDRLSEAALLELGLL